VTEETADERVRVAEVVGALCLATDLAMGFPFEHGFRSTLVAMRLADRLGVDDETATRTYYVCLLSYAGCTADAEIDAELFGGSMTEHFAPVMFGSPRELLGGLARALPDPGRSPPVRAAQLVRRLPRAARHGAPHLAALCEVAEMLTGRLGLPQSIAAQFALLTERWDGKSRLGRARGDEIPLPLRITHVARDATFQRLIGGVEQAGRVVASRAGHAFDPHVATLLADEAPTLLAADPAPSAWDALLAAEPGHRVVLEGAAVDRALAAVGDFADLVSPSFIGHAAGVAALAGDAATRMGLADRDVTAVRRAGLVHDVGRVAVPTGIWQKPGPLDADDWEKVRLHPYHTERVLAPSPFLARLTATAGAHHERLDGSGYHRGATARELGVPARLLAAADAYHAMTEPRTHRDALSPEVAAETLLGECSAGLLDPDAVAAVLDAAGRPVRRIDRPGGLTERETEVVALIARGLQTKQVARLLGISPKTADHHIQNAYAKIGVSSRAAAALFAMEHGLVALGELPMVTPARRS